jgi:GAF domain-containing protein
MPAAAHHPNEEARLAKLRSYDILDTDREPGFNDIARLASQICETPIAAITLIDRERQWFKAAVGLPIDETARDLAFCAHTILQSEVLQVPDASADPRFADNPMVFDEPRIRFYAGAPIVTADGHPLGTVCVVDRVPKELREDQRRALETLARLTMMLFELRHRARHHEELNRKLNRELAELRRDLM